MVHIGIGFGVRGADYDLKVVVKAKRVKFIKGGGGG